MNSIKHQTNLILSNPNTKKKRLFKRLETSLPEEEPEIDRPVRESKFKESEKEKDGVNIIGCPSVRDLTIARGGNSDMAFVIG